MTVTRIAKTISIALPIHVLAVLSMLSHNVHIIISSAAIIIQRAVSYYDPNTVKTGWFLKVHLSKVRTTVTITTCTYCYGNGPIDFRNLGCNRAPCFCSDTVVSNSRSKAADDMA